MNRDLKLVASAITALFLTYTSYAAPLPPADEAVVLTGWLHVEDLTMRDVVLEIRVNGEVRTVPVSETGRFTMELPADAKATLRFEKPGHLPKEVVVDTRHSASGDFRQRSRKVKFAVILELERRMGHLDYAGPVGRIGFDAEGGCLAVAHDKNMVPAEQHRPMVF